MPLAGQIVRAAHVPEDFGFYAIKAADETVNNSAALQNDDDLVVAAEASSRYLWRAMAKWMSGTTPDIKFDLALPSNATHDSVCFSFARDGAAGAPGFTDSGHTTQGQMFDARMFSTGAVAAIPGAGTTFSTQGRLTFFLGWVTISTTAGDIQLRWAQNTANASDTTVSAGSWLEIVKIV